MRNKPDQATPSAPSETLDEIPDSTGRETKHDHPFSEKSSGSDFYLIYQDVLRRKRGEMERVRELLVVDRVLKQTRSL